jgi:hypothetical protein
MRLAPAKDGKCVDVFQHLVSFFSPSPRLTTPAATGRSLGVTFVVLMGVLVLLPLLLVVVVLLLLLVPLVLGLALVVLLLLVVHAGTTVASTGVVLLLLLLLLGLGNLLSGLVLAGFI